MVNGETPGQAARGTPSRLAADVLGDLGLVRRGRSPRNWIGDHGWWLLHVWLPPSALTVPMSVLVGTQHPWTLHPGWQIDDDAAWIEEREPERAPSTSEVAAAGERYPGAAAPGAAAQVRTAALAVRRIERAFADQRAHLEGLARVRPRDVPGTGVQQLANTVLANAMLGRIDVCRKVLQLQRNSLLHDPDREQDWFGLDEQLDLVAQLQQIVAADDPVPLIVQRVQSGRAGLGLPPTDRPPEPPGPPLAPGPPPAPGPPSPTARRTQ